MALNQASLTAGFVGAFVTGGASPLSPLTLALCNALAAAVILEFQANAEVLPGLLVAPAGGGPVTGTGKVK